MVETRVRKQLALVGWLGALAVGYYFAAHLGLSFRFQHSIIGVVWVANAVLVSALVLTPPARWPLVLMITAAAHVAAMVPVVPAWRIAWQIAGNSVLTISMATVLRRLVGVPLTFSTSRQVLAYMATAFGLAALFALITPAVVRAVLELEDFTPLAAWVRVTLSNATAMLLVTPVILLWAQQGVRPLFRVRTRELMAASAVLIFLFAVGLIAFGTGPETARFPALLLLMFPPLLWAAVRLGPLGASTALLGIAALSVWGTARQLGPFVMIADAYRVTSLQVFWITMCMPLLVLAGVMREREQADAQLQAQRNQLAHVTRVATVGQLSGALAHELRQPLMAILANTQAASALLARDGTNAQEIRTILNDIADQDRYAANVITRMRSFLQERAPRAELLQLESLVRDALALARAVVVRLGVEVETDIPTDLPPVRGDPVQLLQVVLNLIVNGCEAMIDKPARERQLRVQMEHKDANFVELTVVDRGTGLPPDAPNRLFEPFYTTKVEGLGLGLAIGRSIVTAHGGRLWAENNQERGATFHVVLRTANGDGRDTTGRRNGTA